MSTTVLGKVAATPKGAYNAGTTYTKLDIVTYGGGSYMCLQECTGVTPAAGEYWQLIASKGDKGEDGDITNVAEGFSASTAYAKGDYVLYNGTLYQFTAAHAAGVWTGSDAQAVILTDVVTDLKDDLNDITRFNIFDEIMEVGNINNNGTNGNSTDRIRSKNFIPVYAGVDYYFKIPTTSSFYRIAWYNSSKTFISYADRSSSYVVTAPDNAAFIRIQLAPSYGTIYNNDVCINISQPNTSANPHNGQYVAHSVVDHTMYEKTLTNEGDIVDIKNDLKNLYFDFPVGKDTLAYIRYSDGVSVSSTNAHYYTIRNVGYTKIRIYGKSSPSIAAIAFFSGTVSSATYIKASSLAYPALAWAWLEADVPASAKYIVVTSDINTADDSLKVQFLTKDLYNVIEAQKEEELNRFAYAFPFANERSVDHLFVSQVTSAITNNIIFPCQSVFHVAVSARMGFKYIEGNVQKTATDGKYIVTHGISGKLGNDFEDLNGNPATDVVIANTSYNDLRSNYRYISQYPQYRVPPTSLEEFLYACRENNMFPLLQYRDDTMLAIAKSIVGNNMILYDGNHLVFDGITNTYRSFDTKEAILAECVANGKPYVYGMANPADFTDEELEDIFQSVHEAGYYIAISSAYTNETQVQRCYHFGLDYDSVDKRVPVFESGNLATLTGGSDFSDFTTVGTALNGLLTLTEGQTLNTGQYSGEIVKYCIKIMFNGTLTIDNKTLTSDGTQMIVLTGYRINSYHSLWITAVAETTISMLKYAVSKC